jgi:hypothetical protein
VSALKSVNFSYVMKEDRVLAAINPGELGTWSCWLTRRLVLALLERADKFLANTSDLIKHAPAEVRGELATFEREAAVATTAKAMSKTPVEAINASATLAELVERLTISSQENKFRVELRGEKGGAATGLLSRAELQRVLLMLQVEVAKSDWLVISGKPSATPAPEEKRSKPVRH